MTTDFATRVAQYRALRDEIKRLNDEHKKKMAPYNETLEQLNSALLQHLDAVKANSVNTEAGTAYKTLKKSATIADGAAFRQYVVATGDWDLADWRANAVAIEQYIDKQAEAAKSDPTITPVPPPGVNFSTHYEVGVRKN